MTAGPRSRRVAGQAATVWLLTSLGSAAVLAWVLEAPDVPTLVILPQLAVLLYLEVWLLGHLDDLKTTDGVPLSSLGAANLVTIARCTLVPPVALALLLAAPEVDAPRRAAVVALLVVALLSDSLDGVLARRLGQVTRLGSFLDPTADFFLQLVLATALAARGLMPLWFAGLVVARIVLLVLGGFLVLRTGRIERTRLAQLRLGRASVAATLGSMGVATALWAAGLAEVWAAGLTAVYAAAAALVLAAIGEKAWLFVRLRREVRATRDGAGEAGHAGTVPRRERP